MDIKLKQFPEHLLGVETIQKGAPLGRGGTATVFNGKYGVIPVALKQDAQSLDTLLNEAAIIMNLKHPNVVQVYGIWKDRKERVFMVILCVVFNDIGGTGIVVLVSITLFLVSSFCFSFCFWNTSLSP